MWETPPPNGRQSAQKMTQSMLTPVRAKGISRPAPARTRPPLITVAVPAYNRPALLGEALASIAAQSVDVPLEVLVCDDLGIPENRAVVDRFPGDTYRYSANPSPLGAVGNWNRCLRMARGKWVMVLHEDDTLYPWYLESVLPHLRNDAVAVCTKTSRGRVVPKVRRPGSAPPAEGFQPQHFLKSSMTPFPGVLIRRDVARRLGGFDESWGPIADYEFWYRLGCTGRVNQVGVVGAFYRVAPGQWTERVWGRMLGLTHLLRLRMASEQFPQYPRAGRWLARFFTYRNARCYAARFKERPAVLRRSLGLGRMSFAWLPSGWVWQALKLVSRLGTASRTGASAARRSRGYCSGAATAAPARVF
jgi:glycosyltransferase involved in cell wall biosynthesis